MWLENERAKIQGDGAQNTTANDSFKESQGKLKKLNIRRRNFVCMHPSDFMLTDWSELWTCLIWWTNDSYEPVF